MCASINIIYIYMHEYTEYFCWCVSDESQYDMRFNIYIYIHLYDYMMYIYIFIIKINATKHGQYLKLVSTTFQLQVLRSFSVTGLSLQIFSCPFLLVWHAYPFKLYLSSNFPALRRNKIYCKSFPFFSFPY